MCKDYEKEMDNIIKDMFTNMSPDEIKDYVEDHIPGGFPKNEDE